MVWPKWQTNQLGEAMHPQQIPQRYANNMPCTKAITKIMLKDVADNNPKAMPQLQPTLQGGLIKYFVLMDFGRQATSQDFSGCLEAIAH